MKNKILLSVAALAVSTQLMAQNNVSDKSFLTISTGKLDLQDNKDNSYYRLGWGANNYFLEDYMVFGVEIGLTYAPDMHKSSLVQDKNVYEFDTDFKLGGHIAPINLDLYGSIGQDLMIYNEAEFTGYSVADSTQASYAFTTGVGAQWYYDDWFTITTSYKTGTHKNPDLATNYDYKRFNVGVGICW